MIRGHPGELWSFCNFMELPKKEVTKWQKAPICLKCQNKGTFFSSTLKVDENKVPLIFWF